jgi:hypothetical protein
MQEEHVAASQERSCRKVASTRSQDEENRSPTPALEDRDDMGCLEDREVWLNG